MFAGLGLVLGLLAGTGLTRWSLGDRVVIGGTGTELSVLIEVSGRRVVVGGGSSRSDLVGLVDRSTLPWDRSVDLLLVPAWDARHLPGAIELVDRGHVAQVLVIGLPEDDQAWAVLERLARARGTAVSYRDEPGRVPLAGDISVTVFPPREAGSSSQGIRAVAELGRVRMALVDAPRNATTLWQAATGAHLVVALRTPPDDFGPTLLVRPVPRWATAFTSPPARYEIALDRGQRVTARFTGHEFRLPLEVIEPSLTPAVGDP